MEEDLPYRAEYSKSGRANCKGCQNPIAKGVLRLAVVVQSPVFDGKITSWYHFACFFGKQRPKSVADIAHFESLRWDDQEKIKSKIESSSLTTANGGAKSGSSKGKGKKRGKASLSGGDFRVEYAKSSRAMCRACEDKIMKEQVRISKKDYESEEARRYGGLDRWYHLECFTKVRVELGFLGSGDSLPGINSLSKEDRNMLKEKLIEIQPIKKEELDQPSPSKKIKLEGDDTEKMKKEQNEMMFMHRDNLSKLEKNELIQLLQHNKQGIPAGIETILDRLSDIMTFGVPEPCEKCKDGYFVFQSGVGYRCQGNVTEWTKCEEISLEPSRTKFKVPKDMAKEHGFLKSYKSQIRKRVFLVKEPKVKVEETHSPKVEKRILPLRDMEVVILGDTTKPKDKLKKEIAALGGKVVTKIHKNLGFVISTPDVVEKMGARMKEVEKCEIQVVPEDILEELQDGGASVIIKKKSICSWGSDPETRVNKHRALSVPKSRSMASKFKSNKSTVKMTMKGGFAVDPDSGIDDVAHVLKEGKDVYTVVLGITDIQSGKNSFYKMQVLESDHSRDCWFFRSWGRIGTTIGGNKLEKMPNKEEAIDQFKFHYEDKSGNLWDLRKRFCKVPGKMYPIDVDYGDEVDSKMDLDVDMPCSLPTPVQDLLKLLFDVDTMKKVMREFELDLEKMPLGKLSKKQIQEAFGVLTELQELINKGSQGMMMLDASNRFYTLIPHDFGMDNPPIIDSEELIKQKIEMVESLLEIEIAYNLMKSSKDIAGSDKHPLEMHYEKLQTDIEILTKDSEEFKMLQQYAYNTHAKTHSHYTLEIEEIFKIKRKGEEKRYKPFKKLPNRKLLWHGSRLTNFVGILSQGLRIAPPEAPVTGYMFGKGIYFADMVSKSANYCSASRNSPTGLMLLCEVALGNMHEAKSAEYITKLPKGKHSCKGMGRTSPKPEDSVMLPNGVEVPLGKGVDTKTGGLSLLYNEYIVYDVAQVNIQYLFKMKFNF